MRTPSRGTELRYGKNGKPKINHRPPRCTSHRDKAAGKQMLKMFHGDLAKAKKLGWLKK